MSETKLKRLRTLDAQLTKERESFIPTWREAGEYLSPRAPRFMTSDVNKGDRRNQKVIDNTGSRASRAAVAGMMSGITSPARAWFRLAATDPSLAESDTVKNWLYIVEKNMTTILLKSNLYKQLPMTYRDLLDYGTHALFVEEDFDYVFRTHAFPIGTYKIAVNHLGVVDTFVRDFQMTVRNLIKKFGRSEPDAPIDWTKFSTRVKDAYEKGALNQWIDVQHFILPNEDFCEGKLESKYKAFASIYIEKGASEVVNGKEKFLSEKGYEYFPVLCPRWEVSAEDSYGTNCPGILAIGDIKQLQHGENRMMEVIDKMVRPPTQRSVNDKDQPSSLLPGDMSLYNPENGNTGIKPIFEVNPRIAELANKQEELRGRIKEAYFANLFLKWANNERSGTSATEVDATEAEKLLMLGPVYEQVSSDLLDPLIDIVFNLAVRQSNFEMGTGPIPPPPPELEGMKLRVEYISVMAQAQKLAGSKNVEHFFAFVGKIAATDPTVVRKIDFHQAVDHFGDIMSIVPGIIRSDEKVAEMAQAAAKAQQQQAMMEQMKMATGAAKDLAQSDVSGDNVLSRLMNQEPASEAMN